MSDVVENNAEESAAPVEETYEYECLRAELLGLPVPERKERPANLEVDLTQERAEVEGEELNAKNVEELENQSENLKGVSGGLEELTNILSLTQKKINRFKTVCGSIKNLFKLRGQDLDGNLNSDGEGSACATDNEEEGEDKVGRRTQGPGSSEGEGEGKATLNNTKHVAATVETQLTCQIDKLDQLVMKAEAAEMSMASQNKQMRKIINK